MGSDLLSSYGPRGARHMLAAVCVCGGALFPPAPMLSLVAPDYVRGGIEAPPLPSTLREHVFQPVLNPGKNGRCFCLTAQTELLARGERCCPLARIDASASLPLGRADRASSRRLLGGDPEHAVRAPWGLTWLWREKEDRNEGESCQKGSVEAKAWNPVEKVEAGL